MVYLQHCLVVAWLMPRETATVLAHGLCAPMHQYTVSLSRSHIRRVYVCLDEICHLHVWRKMAGIFTYYSCDMVVVGYENIDFFFKVQRY